MKNVNHKNRTRMTPVDTQGIGGAENFPKYNFVENTEELESIKQEAMEDEQNPKWATERLDAGGEPIPTYIKTLKQLAKHNFSLITKKEKNRLLNKNKQMQMPVKAKEMLRYYLDAQKQNVFRRVFNKLIKLFK